MIELFMYAAIGAAILALGVIVLTGALVAIALWSYLIMSLAANIISYVRNKGDNDDGWC